MKPIVKFITICVLCISLLHAQCTISSTQTGVFPATISGVTITMSTTGDVTNFPWIYTATCGLGIGPTNMWIIHGGGTLGVGTATLNFSAPVNNVVIFMNAASNVSFPPEQYTFSVNNGVLTSIPAPVPYCGLSQVGNTFTSTAPTNDAIIRLSSTLPYTSLTISGNGNLSNNGALFSLCNASITPSSLPVTLVEFTSSCNEHHLVFNWSTSSEINNDHFTLEKSHDLITWTEIGRISGNGNSNQFSNYEYTSNPFPEKYVRLVQFDYDGTKTIFDPNIINCDITQNFISIYPNPVVDNININSNEEITKIEMINSQGQIVYSLNSIVSKDINLTIASSLTNGIYIVKVYTNTKVYHEKVIINH